MTLPLTVCLGQMKAVATSVRRVSVTRLLFTSLVNFSAIIVTFGDLKILIFFRSMNVILLN
jgi:hypothetical protein